MTNIYLKMAPGIYRKCSHEKTIKVWEKKYTYIQMCKNCGTFWHVYAGGEYEICIHNIHAHMNRGFMYG